jgi:hypothetical protein
MGYSTAGIGISWVAVAGFFRLEMVGGASCRSQVWTKMMKSGKPEKLKKQQPSSNRKQHRRTAIFAGRP